MKTTPSRVLVGTFFASFLACAPVLAQETISGQARVLDGDTLDIGGQRIRLHGIDAPESSQSCYLNDRAWECGKAAAWELGRKVEGFQVSCQVVDTDRYGRKLAQCWVNGGSLNGWMVENGWALAYERYSKQFSAHQARAKAAGVGIWSSKWSSPEQYRRQQGAQP